MPPVDCDDLRFSGFPWIFKWLAQKHIENGISHARPFNGTFYRLANGLVL
jgi:hypothetical protein